MKRRMSNEQQKPTFLTKSQSSYKKLEGAMKDPVKEYDKIKQLVEENDIEILKNKSENTIKLTPHQKKNNIKSKKKIYYRIYKLWTI